MQLTLIDGQFNPEETNIDKLKLIITNIDNLKLVIVFK